MKIGSQGQSCHSIALRRCTTRLTFTPVWMVYLLRRLVRWPRVHHIQPSVGVFRCLTWRYGCALGRKPTTGCGYPPSSCRAVLGCSTNVLKHSQQHDQQREPCSNKNQCHHSPKAESSSGVLNAWRDDGKKPQSPWLGFVARFSMSLRGTGVGNGRSDMLSLNLGPVR